MKGIVQVCEVGAKRGNETERKRGGDGGGVAGVYNRQRGERMREERGDSFAQ